MIDVPCDIAIACDPRVFGPGELEAHLADTRSLLAGARLVELDDGWAIDVQPSALRLVATWIADERRCCPFLSFEVAVPARGALRLSIRGPEGSKEALRGPLAAHHAGSNPAASLR